MDESVDKGLGDKGLGNGSNAENKAEKSAAENKLPVVWSPKLGASDDSDSDVFAIDAEDIPESETARDGAGTATKPASSRSSKFALLAAGVAIAAAAGSFTATLTAVGLGQMFREPAADTTASIAETTSVAHVLKSELAELTALKSSLDNATRSATAQFTTIAERLDRVEHAQADPAGKLAHISDTVDKLEKISGAPETTASIGSAPAPASAAAPAPTEAKITDRILQDWIVEGVHGDKALVESRYGGEFLVAAGGNLPGLGRVDAIKRLDGQWVVITTRGTITSGR